MLISLRAKELKHKHALGSHAGGVTLARLIGIEAVKLALVDACLQPISRAIKGVRILQVGPTGPGEWTKGWVYNPEDGKTYKAELKLLGGGRLKMTGCVAKPLCQSQSWTRISSLTRACSPRIRAAARGS